MSTFTHCVWIPISGLSSSCCYPVALTASSPQLGHAAHSLQVGKAVCGEWGWDATPKSSVIKLASGWLRIWARNHESNSRKNHPHTPAPPSHWKQLSSPKWGACSPTSFSPGTSSHMQPARIAKAVHWQRWSLQTFFHFHTLIRSVESFHDRAISVFFGNGCVETESPHIALATLELAVWAKEAQLERF